MVVTVPPVVQGSILPMLHSERRRSCGWLQAFLSTCKDHPQDTSIRLFREVSVALSRSLPGSEGQQQLLVKLVKPVVIDKRAAAF